jgi:Flp pilus assembly pilin Flp
MVRALWALFVREDRGHGLAEYCLVAAFIAMIALGLYLHVSGGVQDLWSTANSTLVSGNTTSSGASGTSTGTGASVGAH